VIRRVRALANKTSLEKVPLDVNDVVRETIPLVQRELISHQVLLRMELARISHPIFAYSDAFARRSICSCAGAVPRGVH